MSLKLLFLALRTLLGLLYFFLKRLPIQPKVVMISRQYNAKPLDFALLEKEIIKRESYSVVVLCKKIEGGLKSKIEYGVYMLRCLYHLATASACIVDSYCIPVSMLKHRKQLIVIQIWHSLGAIKKFGYQNLDTFEGRSSKVARLGSMHRNYSYITCASEITKSHYAEAFQVSPEKIFVEGMPRLDYIIGTDLANYRIRERIYKKYPQLRKKKTILYVPTFRKEVSIDLNPLLESIDPEKYNLVVKLHPLDHACADKSFAIFSNFSTYDLMKVADYYITDYSGTAFEACVLHKPLFFYVFDYDQYAVKRGLNVDLFEEYPDCTFRNFADLMTVLNSGYYNYNELEKFRSKYVQFTDIGNAKRIVEHMMREVEKAKRAD